MQWKMMVPLNDHDGKFTHRSSAMRINRRSPIWKLVGYALGVICMLIALGCSNDIKEGRTNTPNTRLTNEPSPETSSGYGAMTVSWTTPLGQGGAQIPAAQPEAPEAGDNSAPWGISRLRGAVFPPNGEEVLFIGTVHEGEPVFTPDDLLDGFAVALRALEGGAAPAVSIDPTAEQINAELKEGDLMPVRYDGDISQTATGQVMFEADRIMKALSSGRDNLTRAAFSSRVEGYRSRLDMHALDTGGKYTPWTRFWIEQEVARIEISEDGTAVLVTPTLKVEAKSQIRQEMVDGRRRTVNWRLADGDDSITAPSAKEFARHMTRYYDKPDSTLDFVREFPVYRQLLVHATLVCLAEAVRPGTTAPAAPIVDLEWILFEYPVKPVETRKTTPATIASRKTANSLHMIRGGVDLKPTGRYRYPDARSQALASAVMAAIAEHPGRRWFNVRFDDTTYYVYPVSLRDPTLRIWQTDLRNGLMEIVRVSGTEGGGPVVGTNWSLRIPSVTLPDARVKFESLGELEPFAVVQGLDGRRVRLHQVGRVKLPGQPSTLSYSLVEPSGRGRQLLMFDNAWIYIDGHVDFVSINRGPMRWELAPEAFVLHFEPIAPHRLRRVEARAGTVEYTYDAGGKLDRLTSGGAEVMLAYDGDGNLVGLSSSNHGTVVYRIGRDGFLDTVEDKGGNWISYSRDTGSRRIAGMSAKDVEMTSGKSTHPRFVINKSRIQNYTQRHK